MNMIRFREINKQQIKKALHIYYTAPLQTVFKQFRHGAIFFAVGLIIIYLSSSNLPPSIKQELITLAGLAVMGYGFLFAMMAQIRLIIGRLYQFIIKK